ncbi:DNA polymerase I [Patescibacteria group bacterium]|nr:DNA polymerase I [Patescibacteria group bacterium]
MNKKRIKLALIDGNALIHRGFHALPPLTTSQGELVNAVYGFTMILLKALEELKPTHIAVTFDRKGKTFRHKMYKDYKARREAAPNELYKQIPRVQEIVTAFNMPIYSMKGYEADDFIGTLSKTCHVPNVIVTGDNDALQLVDDDTQVYTLRRGFKDTIIYDEKKVENKFNGLKPDQLIDYKGLAGDSSDNIPGVQGVGEKTAIKLLLKFGTLEKLYEAIKQPDFADKNKKQKLIRPKTLETLLAQEKQAFLSKKLGTIVTDMKVNFNLADAELKDFDIDKVVKLFQELEFRNLLNKIPEPRQIKAGPTAQASLFDKKKVAEKFSLQDKCQTHGVKYHLLEDHQEIRTFLDKLAKTKTFAVDTETTSLRPLEAKLIGISFALKEKEAYYLANFLDLPADLQKQTKDILENKNIKKIAHNFKYDYIIFKNHGINLQNVWFDTMVASYLLESNSRRHSLDDLAFKEFSYKMVSFSDLVGTGKDKKDITEVNKEKLAFYASEDADMTLKLNHLFIDRFKEEKKLEKLFFDIEMPLVIVLSEMEIAGIKVDKKKLEKLSKEFGQYIVDLTQQIYELAGTKAFNINSTQQLSEILFKTLKIPVKGLKKTQKGVSTAASELAKIRQAHPIVTLIEQYRELAKLQNTYVDTLPKLVNNKTGRIHTSFNQTITATGRLSSSDPNLQNIPIRSKFGTKIREAFVADKDQKLISADYSQIDLRVVASISKDPEMTKAFKNGEDIHGRTAALVFGKKQSEVSKKERNFAKTINFGVLYGMSAFGLSQTLNIAPADAQEYIDTYYQKHPGIKEYADKTIAFARKNGYVETLVGRRRYLPELQSSTGPLVKAGERIAINMPVQGTSADIIKIAMNNIYQEMIDKKLPLKMLLQIHDELIFEVPQKEVAAMSKLVQKRMEEAFTLNVPLKVEVCSGDNWGELK